MNNTQKLNVNNPPDLTIPNNTYSKNLIKIYNNKLSFDNLKNINELQAKFTPKKSYPLFKTIENREIKYKIDFSPDTKKELKRQKENGVGVIYRFKNDENKRYEGRSETGIDRAIQHLNNAANDTESPLYDAIRKKPESFTFGIVAKADSPSKLDKLEILAIDIHDTTKTGYNRRRGGGGGHAIKAVQHIKKTEKQKDKTRDIVKAVKEVYEKVLWRDLDPVGSTRGAFKFNFTENEKKKKDQIYVIQHKTSNQTYLGRTTQTIAKRFARHIFDINHIYDVDHKKRSNQKIHTLCHKYPLECRAGLLDLDDVKDKYNITSVKLEAIAIEALKELGLTRTNKNKGGGGGVSKKN